jgi:hypothetical protein
VTPGTVFGENWLTLNGIAADGYPTGIRAVKGNAAGGSFPFNADLDAAILVAADAHGVWPILRRIGGRVGASCNDAIELGFGWKPRAAIREGAGVDAMCPCRKCVRVMMPFGLDCNSRPDVDDRDAARCTKTRRVDLAADPELAALQFLSDAPPGTDPYGFCTAFPAVARFASSKGRFQRVAVGRAEGGVRIIAGKAATTLFSSDAPRTAHAAFAAAEWWLAHEYYGGAKPKGGERKHDGA